MRTRDVLLALSLANLCMVAAWLYIARQQVARLWRRLFSRAAEGE